MDYDISSNSEDKIDPIEIMPQRDELGGIAC